jgi:hypothetical protein
VIITDLMKGNMMYNVSVRKNMEIDLDDAGNLVAQVLQEDFDFISKEIIELKSKRDIKSYEAEDLKRNIEVRDAMKIIMSYYMVKREYNEFMELQRVYGNV